MEAIRSVCLVLCVCVSLVKLFSLLLFSQTFIRLHVNTSLSFHWLCGCVRFIIVMHLAAYKDKGPLSVSKISHTAASILNECNILMEALLHATKSVLEFQPE